MKTLKRRRKENKTNYLKRLKLLKGEVPRIVFRKTNRYLISQYVVSEEAQDSIKIGINSKKLLNYGWPKENKGSLKSIPASYLLGFLMGNQITKEKLKTPIIDFGLHRVLHKTKVHSFIKGLIDSGIKIKHKEEALPKEEKIKGQNTKKIPFEEIKSKIKEK
ncbi:MAG: 50S ribosomal protein L18 [archaeon]